MSHVCQSLDDILTVDLCLLFALNYRDSMSENKTAMKSSHREGRHGQEKRRPRGTKQSLPGVVSVSVVSIRK